jgi:hypothetical protein
MSRPIRTYEELVLEKHKLQQLLEAQRELIQHDIQDLKKSVKPVINSVSFLGKFTTRSNSDMILGTTANSVIDLLVKRVLLAKAGWVKRLVIPFVLKNISSHYIADHKSELRNKLLSVIGFRRNGKHQKAPDLSEN